MGKRALCWLLSLLMAGGLAGCALPAAAQEATYLDVFDTACFVTVYGVTEERFAAEEARLHQLLLEYHRLYDIYHAYDGMNNLKTVNDAAGGDPVAVDERILDLLEYGVEMYAATDGRVNILLGSVLSLWHDSREAGLEDPACAALPDGAALAAAGRHCDPASLVIDRAAGTVQITDPQARLDVGAIAKGFATERAAQFAAGELGWRSALLNIGGNVRAIGRKKGGNLWKVGIQNPDTDSAREYLTTVAVEDAAVVTSGDYQRYYTVDGKRYAHIIDADTLYPAAYVRSVSVICADSGLADALSTALFTMPVEQGEALLRRHSGVQALWVLPDGSILRSEADGAP